MKKWRQFDSSKFPQQTRDLLYGKADRSIRNSMTPDDLSAVIRERRGEQILKPDGTPYDHIMEYAQARRAVVKSLEAIDERRAKIGDQAVPGEVDVLAMKRRDLSSLMDAYEVASGGEP
ncbi:MAG: polymorphic toxin type 28 domain-containing protein [bacterium]